MYAQICLRGGIHTGGGAFTKINRQGEMQRYPTLKTAGLDYPNIYLPTMVFRCIAKLNRLLHLFPKLISNPLFKLRKVHEKNNIIVVISYFDKKILQNAIFLNQLSRFNCIR